MSRYLPVLALGATVLVTLTACGSQTTGAATTPSKPATTAPTTTTATGPSVPGDQVIAVLNKNIDAATAVHVKGTIKDGTDSDSVDMQINVRDGSGAGTIGVNGALIPVIETTDKVVYLKFTKDFIKASGVGDNAQVAALLLDKWVPSTSKLFAGSGSDFAHFLDIHGLLGGFGKDSGSLVPAGSDVVDGESVDVYTDADDGKVYVTKAAPHNLVRLAPGPKDGPGGLDLTGWNQPVPVAPPPASQIYHGPGA